MRARREAARAEAVVRLARWKRAIGAGAVIAFGALVGLVGVAGAKGDDKQSTTTTTPPSPSVTSQLERPERGDDGPPTTTAGDGYFSGHDSGYGFSDSGSQSKPLGTSGVS